MIIDKNIIKASVDAVILRYKKGDGWNLITDLARLEEEMYPYLLVTIWVRALDAANAYILYDRPVVAEAAVAACIRAGAPMSKVIYNSFGCFTIQLDNLSYIIRKEVSGFSALPADAKKASHRRSRRVIGFTSEQFADFLISFDRFVPDIMAAKKAMMSEVEKVVLEKKKKEMIEQVQSTAARAIATPYIEPLGLELSGCLVSEGVVHLRFHRAHEYFGYMDIPFCKLQDELSDTSKIIGSLEPIRFGGIFF